MSNKAVGIPGNWWGKMIGAVIGLMRGGLSGAILGALVGHFFDRLVSGFRSAGNTRQVFFQALFSTLGHVNKADGRVSEAEIRAAESLMARMQLSPAERQRAIGYFRAGKEPGFELEKTLRTFMQHTVMRHDLRQMFMEVLLDAAMADGGVSAAEQAVLLRVCKALHIPATMFSAMWGARSGSGPGPGAAGGQRAPAGGGLSLQQAYATLGITERASDAEIKRAYRKLVGQYHPDKLVSRGLPEEMMERAKQRVREINLAYDRLKQARGIK